MCNIAKKIVGRQFTVERVKAKSGPTKKSRAKTPAWFNDFINNRFSKLEKEVSSLRSDFDRVIELNELQR